MRLYWIGPLLTILLLSSTTTITTTFAFFIPRSGGSHIAPSLTRVRSPFSKAHFSLARSNKVFVLPPFVGVRPWSFGDRIMGSNDGNAKKRPLSATTTSSDAGEMDEPKPPTPEPLYLEEGLFAVQKPLGWTSQDVVGKLRFLLEADAKARNAPDGRTKRRRPWMKVGHGGTLDPLATGVLVCGVGAGTKSLQKYLVGSKAYLAEVTLGYQTTTLDGDPKGEIVDEQPFDHVTSLEAIHEVLQSKFTGKIQQIPPVFSALKRDGKKLYELGRQGKTAEDLKIEPREVIIYNLKLVGYDGGGGTVAGATGATTTNGGSTEDEEPKQPIQKFFIEVECGGGTYIRSLVRDIGIALGTVATMTQLERTKQGQFFLEHSLPYSSSIESGGDNENEKDSNVKRNEDGAIWIDKREDCNWTVATINEAIRTCRDTILTSDNDGLRDK